MTDTPQDPYAGAPGPGAGPEAAPGPGTYPGGPYPAGNYPGGPQAGPYPPYGYPYPYPPMAGSTNTLAILALVFAFIFAPAAIVMGVIARRQIRRTGEQGMGLATAGMVVGIVFTALSVIWIVVMITLFASMAHQINEQENAGTALLAARAWLGL